MKINLNPRKLVLILGILVVILGMTTGYFFYRSNKNSNPALASQVEAKALATKVGKLIVLPTDETPTIATVSDPEALKNQPFFVDAKKGDKVLIYTNAKKAILYDPVANKIVNVAPLNVGDGKTTLAPTPDSKPIPTPTTAPKDKF